MQNIEIMLRVYKLDSNMKEFVKFRSTFVLDSDVDLRAMIKSLACLFPGHTVDFTSVLL